MLDFSQYTRFGEILLTPLVISHRGRPICLCSCFPIFVYRELGRSSNFTVTCLSLIELNRVIKEFCCKVVIG